MGNSAKEEYQCLRSHTSFHTFYSGLGGWGLLRTWWCTYLGAIVMTTGQTTLQALEVSRLRVIAHMHTYSEVPAARHKNGTISTFAGNGSNGFTASGGPALQVAIGLATGIAVDASGNVFFSDCLNQQVSMISSSTLMMTPVAGTGVAGFSGDNGTPNQAKLSCPTNLAFGSDGALYVLDSSNLRIRRIVLVP